MILKEITLVSNQIHFEMHRSLYPLKLILIPIHAHRQTDTWVDTDTCMDVHTYIYASRRMHASHTHTHTHTHVCNKLYLGVGFTNGTVRVLDSVSLEDCCTPFHHSKDCVTHIAFSHDSMYIATAVSHLYAHKLKTVL